MGKWSARSLRLLGTALITCGLLFIVSINTISPNPDSESAAATFRWIFGLMFGISGLACIVISFAFEHGPATNP